MKKVILGLAPVLFLVFASPVLAKQGCCSHHDGVCGCSGGRQVCCDGSFSPSCTCYSPPVVTTAPTSTPKPTLKPTIKPTSSPSPAETATPNPSPEVLSVTEKPTPEPEVKGDIDSSGGWGWLTIPGGLIGWILWKYRHTFGGTKGIT